MDAESFELCDKGTGKPQLEDGLKRAFRHV